MRTKGLLSVVLLTLLALGLILPQAALAGNWTFTGSLNTPRMYHTVTRLADGRVLAAGGTSDGSNLLQSCELYDPAKEKWTPAGDLIRARIWHTAVLLPNGQVLVVGGRDSSELCAYAELYTPSPGGPGSWSDAGTLNVPRVNHTCTLLADGKVLVAGGAVSGSALKSCELFYGGTWHILTGTGNLNTARQHHTATLLTNGQVLVEGGQNDATPYYLKSAEIFDGSSWSSAGNLNTTHGDAHNAVLEADGQVVVTGGFDGSQITNATDVYDAGEWIARGGLNEARMWHAGVCLANGKPLVVGGKAAGGVNLTSAEIYTASIGSWSLTDSLNTARVLFSAVLLTNGKVLVAGGNDGSGVPLKTAELYNPYARNTGGALSYFEGTGHWYKAFTFSANEIEQVSNTWEDAKAKAIGMGGYLATATSEAENNFIVNLIKEDKFWWTPGDPDMQHAQGPWLGSCQDYQNDATWVQGLTDESSYYVWKGGGGHVAGEHVYADQAWKWVTGEPWSYTNWADGEPNDYPRYEWPAYERGHANYLHYFNGYYDPTNPLSTKWDTTWEDSNLDNYGGRTLGYIVEWDQKPQLPGNIAPLNMLLMD